MEIKMSDILLARVTSFQSDHTEVEYSLIELYEVYSLQKEYLEYRSLKFMNIIRRIIEKDAGVEVFGQLAFHI